MKIFSIICVVILSVLVYINDSNPGRIRMFYPLKQWSTKDLPNLTGKIILITGANVGIGKESALHLASNGAKIILACRERKCDPVEKEINSLYGPGAAKSMTLDLSDSKSIYLFAQEYRKLKLPIHSMILNAGIITTQFELTADGLEKMGGVNFIGHFYLQHLLQDVVESSSPSGIVIVSSGAHEFVDPSGVVQNADFGLLDTEDNRKSFKTFPSYGISKLLNIYHAQELALRMKKANKKVYVVSVHPGAVETQLGRGIRDLIVNYVGERFAEFLENLSRVWVMTSSYGALTQVYAAGAPFDEMYNITGSYLVPTAIVGATSDLAKNESLQLQAYEFAESIISKFKLQSIE